MPYSIFPTGTTIYDPKRSCNCYVLYDGRDGRSFLIDMCGNPVHTWPYCGFPVEMIDPEINMGIRQSRFRTVTDHDVESGGSLSNRVFRAQPIPYDWVPDDTPRTETPVEKNGCRKISGACGWKTINRERRWSHRRASSKKSDSVSINE